MDDDPLGRRLLSKHLVQAGYNVITAEDGSEALRIFLDIAPQMIITDWEMPEMTGLELCQRIRGLSDCGWTYMIVVTAHADPERLVTALEAGADDYLTKPFNNRELLARLRAGERIVDLEEGLERQRREIYRSNAEMEVAYQKLAAANEQLTHIATTDPLTELANRRAAMHALSDAWSDPTDRRAHLSCVMGDLDHFKKINDTHGHDVGDLVLRRVAEALRSATRADEQPYRIGGEEFLVFCNGHDADSAAVLAERMRNAVEQMSIELDSLATLNITMSLGVAQRTEHMTRPDDLLKATDTAMYDAKSSGRNCVRTAPHDLMLTPSQAPDQTDTQRRSA